MKILDMRCLRGPNFWSIRHTNLIVMKLDKTERIELSLSSIMIMKKEVCFSCSKLWRAWKGFARLFKASNLLLHLFIKRLSGRRLGRFFVGPLKTFCFDFTLLIGLTRTMTFVAQIGSHHMIPPTETG